MFWELLLLLAVRADVIALLMVAMEHQTRSFLTPSGIDRAKIDRPETAQQPIRTGSLVHPLNFEELDIFRSTVKWLFKL